MVINRMSTESFMNSDNDQYRKFEPEDITTQELAELLPLLIEEWQRGTRNGCVSTNFIKNLDRDKPALKRHFKRDMYGKSPDSLTD